MDSRFKRMLVDAWNIRAQCVCTGIPGPHARWMADTMEYLRSKGLLTGSVFDNTASEEYFLQLAESAALLVGISRGHRFGLVLNRSHESNMALILAAKGIAEGTFARYP